MLTGTEGHQVKVKEKTFKVATKYQIGNQLLKAGADSIEFVPIPGAMVKADGVIQPVLILSDELMEMVKAKGSLLIEEEKTASAPEPENKPEPVRKSHVKKPPAAPKKEEEPVKSAEAPKQPKSPPAQPKSTPKGKPPAAPKKEEEPKPATKPEPKKGKTSSKKSQAKASSPKKTEDVPFPEEPNLEPDFGEGFGDSFDDGFGDDGAGSDGFAEGFGDFEDTVNEEPMPDDVRQEIQEDFDSDQQADDSNFGADNFAEGFGDFDS